MVRDIITYPTPSSVEYGTDVRIFNDDISSIIDDMKETIDANSLEGLAAYQIGSMYNIVVVKQEEGVFLELINPRIISVSDKVSTTETTAYFPELSATVVRHKNISIVYEDRDLKQHTLKADGALSILLQRKIDYTFGANFLSKLSKDEKQIFENKLEYGVDFAKGETCPTKFKRDYMLKFLKFLTVSMVLLLVSSLFIDDNVILNDVWQYQIYLLLAAIGTNIIYFFYAHYEAKQYTSCISCQSGNIIGTVLVSFIKLIVIMSISYFLINPS